MSWWDTCIRNVLYKKRAPIRKYQTIKSGKRHFGKNPYIIFVVWSLSKNSYDVWLRCLRPFNFKMVLMILMYLWRKLVSSLWMVHTWQDSELCLRGSLEMDAMCKRPVCRPCFYFCCVQLCLLAKRPKKVCFELQLLGRAPYPKEIQARGDQRLLGLGSYGKFWPLRNEVWDNAMCIDI